MIYLDDADLLRIARRVVGEVVVWDHGLLSAAVARPRASVFGADAYPSVEAKAAALMHSLARNHPLVDGNKRLALAGAIVFLGVNGRVLTLTNDQAYDLTMSVATGELGEIDDIADRLRRGSRAA